MIEASERVRAVLLNDDAGVAAEIDDHHPAKLIEPVVEVGHDLPDQRTGQLAIHRAAIARLVVAVVAGLARIEHAVAAADRWIAVAIARLAITIAALGWITVAVAIRVTISVRVAVTLIRIAITRIRVVRISVTRSIVRPVVGLAHRRAAIVRTAVAARGQRDQCDPGQR